MFFPYNQSTIDALNYIIFMPYLVDISADKQWL